MKCMYSDRDLPQRLDGSICRYNGRPVYVRYAGHNSLALFEVYDTESIICNIKSSDELLDISTPPLGYTQVTDTRVMYATRMPYRVFKQGIYADNINFTMIDNKNTRNSKMPSTRMFSQYFFDTMSMNYPSVSDLMDKIRKAKVYTELAVSNDVALVYKPENNTLLVYYKNEIVGWIPPSCISGKEPPKVMIKNTDNAWIIELYLKDFNWDIKK